MKFMVYKDGILKVAKADDSYNFLRDTVEGYIERVPLDSLGEIDMWCNEEGKLIGLDPSIVLMHKNRAYDVVVGNVVFTRHDGEGETISLTDKDIEFIKKKFDDDGKIVTGYGMSLAELQVLEF